ncbi:MAG: hypothetical protein HYV35_12915 [Lentisphaerae bacterium]|nr:hypothetical protein [Lentisphaerota bacterium]
MKTFSGLGLAFLLAFMVAPVLREAPAATVTWTAMGTNDWFGTNNWSSQSVPATGDDVVITNDNVTVILTNSTAELSSLLISNKATLLFSNWSTALSATNVTIGGRTSTVTCAGPFTNTVMSNRVWIVCSNLTVAAVGYINVDAKGYAGAATNESRGSGPGNGTTRAGGSYGGLGGMGAYDNGTDTTYGSPDAPLWPGSGGGAYGGSPWTYRGGAGGGAVYIQASGIVTVNGSITANGQVGPTGNSAGGSGGGITITCQVFAGTGGLIQANGGANNGYCGGGGGRIAVIYDAAAQGATSVPSIRFLTDRGLGAGAGYAHGEIGTLYFPDTLFLTNPITQFHGQWFSAGLTNLSYNSLTLSNCWIRFPQEGLRLTVSNDLLITGSAGRLEIGGNRFATNIFEDRAYANMYRRYSEMGTNPFLDCRGNLILTNRASLTVYAGMTNAALTTGAVVKVGSDLWITTGCTVYVYSHPTNGGSVVIEASNVVIQTNASISADYLGFVTAPRRPDSNNLGYGPGRGQERRGAGYGGYGGNTTAVYGLTYGSSNTPVDSGSSGGRYPNSGAGYYGGAGGGVIRLEVTSSVTVDGTLTANGGDLGSPGYSGGGSGGSIFIRCRNFTGATGGIIRANGGGGAYTQSASGGGGRIAVWRIYDSYGGTFSYSSPSDTTYDGTDGTLVLINLPVPGAIITMF